MKIEGNYKIKIWKEGRWYLATCVYPWGEATQRFTTQGKSRKEIFEMIADALMTVHDIPNK